MEVEERYVIMAVGREGKLEMSRYLSENTKTGDINQQRTLSWSFFVIPERLAFTTNKQTNTINHIILA